MLEKDFLNNAVEFTKSIINGNMASSKSSRANWQELSTAIILSYPLALKARSEEARSHYWRLTGNSLEEKNLLEILNSLSKAILYTHIAIGIAGRKRKRISLKRKFQPIVKQIFEPFLLSHIKDNVDWNLWLDDLISYIRFPIELKNFFDRNFPNWEWFEKITRGYRATITNLNCCSYYSNYLPPIFIINNPLTDISSKKKIDDLRILIDAVGDPGYFFALLIEIEELSDSYYKGLLGLLQEKDKRFLRLGLDVQFIYEGKFNFSSKLLNLKRIILELLKNNKAFSESLKFDLFYVEDREISLLVEYLLTGKEKDPREIKKYQLESRNDIPLNTEFGTLSPKETQIQFQKYLNYISKKLNLELPTILDKLSDLNIDREKKKRFRFDKRLLIARMTEHPNLEHLLPQSNRHFNGYNSFFSSADRTFNQLLDIFLAFERYLPKDKAKELITNILIDIYDYSPISYIILKVFNLYEIS